MADVPVPAISLVGVTKSYAGQVAVHPLDLEVPRQRSLALVGPSGSGKSTVLRMVVGLIAPDRGEVRVAGTPLTPATRRALRLRMGYVIQEGGLFPHLTARDNVALMGRELGWARERVDARVAELAELAGLPVAWLDRYPAQLSGGQRQRVGLMRALLLDPEVLLLDEPLGALDPLIRARLQEDLRDIVRRLQKSVLLVTHDMAEAAYLGDEIALLKDGRIVQRGPARELLEHPADPFVTEFIRAQRPLVAAP